MNQGERDNSVGAAHTGVWPGLSEELEGDLLALIESGAVPATLPAGRRAALEAALGEPRIAAFVERARADRRQLVSLGAVAAPAGLTDEAEAEIERQVMAGLAREAAEIEVGELPVSALQPRGASVIAVVGMAARSVWTRRLAAAACVGGAGWLGWTTIANWKLGTQGAGPVRLASGTPSPSGGSAMGTPSLPPTRVELAGGPVRGPSASGPINPTPRGAEGVITEGNEQSSPAVAASVKPTTEAALAAAREGRLVIVVTTADPAGLVGRLSALAETRGAASIGDLRLSRLEASGAIAAAAAVDRTLAAEFADAARRRTSPAFAGEHASASEPVLAPALAAPEPLRIEASAFTARVEASEQSLGSVGRLLSLSPGTSVAMCIVDRPATQPAAMDADSLLWWTAPPGTWPGHVVNVPIVVRAGRALPAR